MSFDTLTAHHPTLPATGGSMADAPPVERPIRLLVVDDHPALRRGVIAMVERHPDFTVVGEGEDGVEAVELFRKHRPDVVLMDVSMPRMDGVAALKSIRSEFSAARVILLTAFDTDEDIYRGMQAGARGYLLKDAPLDTLLNAIRRVHAGYKEVPPAVGAKLSEHVMTDELTEREQEVLQELIKGKSNQEIALALSISNATVKFHINRILGKLDVQDRTQAVITALKRGLARLS